MKSFHCNYRGHDVYITESENRCYQASIVSAIENHGLVTTINDLNTKLDCGYEFKFMPIRSVSLIADLACMTIDRWWADCELE